MKKLHSTLFRFRFFSFLVGIGIESKLSTHQKTKMPPPRARKKLPSTADFPSPRFDPFRRTDRYGARGCAPQPTSEKLRGAAVALALAPLKLCVTLSAVVFFYLVCR